MKTKKILIIDNEPDWLAGAKTYLSSNSKYEVEIANSVWDAMRIIRNEDFDAIVIDQDLADDSNKDDKSGLDFARIVSSSTPKIIVSGSPSFGAVRDAMKSSLEKYPAAFDYLSKSEGFAALSRAIEVAIVRSLLKANLHHKSEKIFISYSRDDWEKYVSPLVEKLKDKGLTTWVDQDLIRGGDNWLDEINRGLKECHILILCVSPKSLESRWVKMEYRYFIIKDKRVIPIICEAAELPAELEIIGYLDYANLDKLIDEL